ncbi:MAG: TRAP transporter large permease subunit [Thermodesulfobacteriota bacterium]
MDWLPSLIVIFGALSLLLLSGLPVAFCFYAINIAGAFLLWGGMNGLHELVLRMYTSVNSFPLTTVIMFVLMGEIMFHSRIFIKIITVLDQWMGRLPGRLALVCVASATLLSTLSGSSMGTTAMLGSLMTGEMERRGYKKPMSIGSCMSGALAMIIPPSALAVILATLAQISVGKVLLAGVIPGLFMAATYVVYIVVRCKLQPEIAPAYVPESIPLSRKIMDTVHYVVPFGLVILVVIGFIVFGVADPTESSALAVVVIALICIFYKSLSSEVLKKSFEGTLQIVVMMLMILTGSVAFSQILAFTGATKGLAEFVVGLSLPPMALFIAMQLLLIVLGCFMEQVSIMMITFPVFLPILKVLEIDLIWFGLLTLINMEVGLKTPPFGFCLFVMRGVATPGTTMSDIIKAAFPFVLADTFVMVLIIVFPGIALWLPSLVK